MKIAEEKIKFILLALQPIMYELILPVKIIERELQVDYLGIKVGSDLEKKLATDPIDERLIESRGVYIAFYRNAHITTNSSDDSM